MPAWKTLTVFLLLSLILAPVYYTRGAAASQATAVKAAVNWLSSNQAPDGSFESFPQIPTPGAALALWLDNSSSPKASKSFSWIGSQLDNSSSYAWGEADIPGLMLYSLGTSASIGLLHGFSTVSSNLESYQAQGSGFMGYYVQLPNGTYAQVVSSVDTSMALLGIFGSNAPFSQQNKTFATNYLFSLENSDGRFNLTSTISESATNALGPEPISVTALALLALRYEGKFTADENHVSRALGFLAKELSANFTSSSNHKGHVYGASLSALAFQAYGKSVQAAASIAFILAQQDADGSFLDTARGSSQKSLDTGWATVALERVQLGPLLSPFLTPIVIAGITVLVAVVAIVAVILAYLVILRKRNGSSRGIATTT